MNTTKITLVGGPTALIEIAGFGFLTDPTFDEPGEYKLPHVTLIKTSRPALSVDQLGTIDAVLLSHDQHSDNLDNSGRAFLKRVSRVLRGSAPNASVTTSKVCAPGNRSHSARGARRSRSLRRRRVTGRLGSSHWLAMSSAS